MGERIACVECGRECERAEMFGAKGDLRCEPCAKGIRERMAPVRTHALVPTGGRRRKAGARRALVVLGVVVGAWLLLSWIVPDRRPAVRLDSGAPVVRQPEELSAQDAYFEAYPLATARDVAAVGSVCSPGELGRALPRQRPGWTPRARASGRGARGASWARVQLASARAKVSIQVLDPGRPTQAHAVAFRAATNTRCAGFPAVESVLTAPTTSLTMLRVVVADRFWIDAVGTDEAGVRAAVQSADLARLQALAGR